MKTVGNCPCAAAHVEETLSTLSYAARAKNIRNQPAVQVGPLWLARNATGRGSAAAGAGTMQPPRRFALHETLPCGLHLV